MEKYDISFIDYTFIKYDFYPIKEEAYKTHVLDQK
jgi:hypothetical protein